MPRRFFTREADAAADFRPLPPDRRHVGVSTAFLFSDWFPYPEIFIRWELFLCFTGLLLTAGFLFFLIRNTEKSLKNSQEALCRADRALQARSECSHILVRATNELELMKKICQIIVEAVGYRLAWVGFAEQDADRTVRPVAQWGYENGYLDTVRISWGENEHGRGPTGTAIRSGQPAVAQHILTDPKWELWREKALRFGYASSLSLPLTVGDQIFGALVIFDGEPGAFNQQEVHLLQGLADDLAYGITSLRIRAEQERRKNEQRLLATIVEQEMDGVLTFNTAGLIEYVNPAFVSISGYSREEIVGRNIRTLEKDGPNQAFFEAMADVLARGEARTDQFINRRNDGTPYDVESRISPVCGVAGISGYAAVIRDLTHEVQLEQQLCLAQKMEAIATLAGGIAHDFNNILAAIITNTEMALDSEPDEEVFREHLALVLKAGLRAKSLVKQILTLSRQGQEERTPVRVESIVKECLKLLRASLPTTVEIAYRPAQGLGLVLADPTQIHQVIMNLCTNAADAMREGGGTLNIRLDNVNLPDGNPGGGPELPEGSYLRLTVTDTGHGMDRKIMDRIFDPFFTTKGPGRGTGLGLSVVHGIVKNHGGGITITSEPDSGTTFHVFLPRSDHAEALPEENTSEPVIGGKERILFLDDEEDLVHANQKILERLGYEVVAGTDSLEALEVFSAQPERFDLVITDQTMPHMTGDILARKILLLRPDIPIILCTGFGQASSGALTEAATRAIGIREVIRKPVERSEMARAIRRVLDEK
jgi:PAS domain S-box-containing protein